MSYVEPAGFKERVKKTIEALRSGEYKQVKGSYRQRNTYDNKPDGKDNCSFCMIGLHAFVHEKSGIPEAVTNSSSNELERSFEAKTGKSLINLNDSENMKFEEFADLLEATYLLMVLEVPEFVPSTFDKHSLTEGIIYTGSNGIRICRIADQVFTVNEKGVPGTPGIEIKDLNNNIKFKVAGKIKDVKLLTEPQAITLWKEVETAKELELEEMGLSVEQIKMLQKMGGGS